MSGIISRILDVIDSYCTGYCMYHEMGRITMMTTIAMIKMKMMCSVMKYNAIRRYGMLCCALRCSVVLWYANNVALCYGGA